MIWSLGRLDFWHARPRTNIASQTYVDHAGWLLSVEDKDKLLATVTVKQLDNTNLAGGGDIASLSMSDVSACALWCVMESRCLSFAYLKPGDIDDGAASTCWIKSSVPDALPDALFISGIVAR